ncbi:tripartite tricarboxylate transporter TctB family protein [Stella humosa]|uniref:Tripartite tricarboxylate transporter TctB family protein n=1 Tax=Stella humosa TaxID=94 RepID=A0A3N1MAK8_9PROT|nr:tripartite tricarboxylate transporter TctB family protein [Stella humosa]ROQ00095.1 tripartite tricarboxylate transporter TctB family protein [Stella humosa]BBK30670.1 tripartite tricarboxylate transporter TctB [Stella humosa]
MTEGMAGSADSGPLQARICSRDVLAGIMFLGLGLAGLWLNEYRIGLAARMGPGYMPMLVFGALAFMGGLVLLKGLVQPGPPVERMAIVATIWILAALLAFALTIERLGLVVATIVLVGVASLAGNVGQPLRVLALAVGMAAFSVAIFVWGLGVTMKVWPWTF